MTRDSTIFAFQKATSAIALNGGRSATRGLLAMPIRQYFVWVGSVLLVALFGADWCLPAPLHIHILKFPRMKGSTFVFVPITNGLNAW